MTKDGRLRKYRQGFARTIYYRQSELDALKVIRPVDDEKDWEGSSKPHSALWLTGIGEFVNAESL
jgi:hypothetical protein